MARGGRVMAKDMKRVVKNGAISKGVKIFFRNTSNKNRGICVRNHVKKSNGA